MGRIDLTEPAIGEDKQWRVLAIDPTPKGFAYAILEGSNFLIDRGIVRAPHEELFDAHVARLCSRYMPHLVALEQEIGSPRRGRSLERIDRALDIAAAHHIATCKVSREQVRETLNADTKMAVARKIGELFPKLKLKQPAARRNWTKEDPRMNIFDAISFALTVLEKL